MLLGRFDSQRFAGVGHCGDRSFGEPVSAERRLRGSSSKVWYLLAMPDDLPVIEVAFLNGQGCCVWTSIRHAAIWQNVLPYY